MLFYIIKYSVRQKNNILDKEVVRFLLKCMSLSVIRSVIFFCSFTSSLSKFNVGKKYMFFKEVFLRNIKEDVQLKDIVI